MKIIYLTNSMLPEDFDDLNASVKHKANPSNQNFHHRLIRAFAISYPVTVISYRPLAAYNDPPFLPYEWKKKNKIYYHYLPIHNKKFVKQTKIIDEGLKLISELTNRRQGDKPLLVVDAMNGTLRRLAKKASAKYHLKTLAVVTDHPLLLTGAKKRQASASIKDMQSFDYYIPLTEALDVLVNPHHKPHLNLPGIAEVRSAFSSYQRPYIFFAGALHERYGVHTLINAFMSTTYDVDLVIAGHGPDHFVKEALKKDPRIKFLGQLSQLETFNYEAGALINVNPRPYEKMLNAYSVPSKFFEYMTSGAPTMSTEHDFLTSKYPKLAIWAGKGSLSDLRMAIVEFMNMTLSGKDRLAKKSKEVVLSEYGIQAVGASLVQFINSLK